MTKSIKSHQNINPTFNMYSFKQLKWEQENDGTIFAKPNGLKCGYYITPLKKNKVELAFLDDYGNCNQKFKYYETTTDAKSYANQHYVNSLSQLIKN